MSISHILRSLAFSLIIFALSNVHAGEKNIHAQQIPVEKQNIAYRWLEITQFATGNEVERNGARPTILSRTMAIWATAMYDAWACYDEKAVGSRLGGKLRRPVAERTLENKAKVISYASYRALVEVYPLDKDYLAGEMKKLGYDPEDKSTDATTPQGIGNLVAQALIDYRRNDGANQLGNEAGGNGKPYSDYTFYKCVNPVDKLYDVDCWQQVTFTLKDGKKVAPGFLTPHWYRVKPFGLEKAEQFRPGPPPTAKLNNEELKKQTQECIDANANLTDEQRAIVEFMRDGPRSTGQSGHWLKFAADVSRRDKHDVDRDVKLFFVVANVCFDAFISCWETKRFYDSPRPYALVRYYFAGQKIKGWLGPDKGVGEIPAEEWRPYSPGYFVTPPFPGYTSGHSTVSAAAAKVLELFTGSDNFGFVEKRKAGVITETPGPEITLKLPTFSATAQMAAESRLLGGYHIRADNEVGFTVGTQVGEYCWKQYSAYFDGTATPRP